MRHLSLALALSLAACSGAQTTTTNAPTTAANNAPVAFGFP